MDEVDRLRVEMTDGRTFEGSPVSIVRDMRALSFDREESLEDYVRASAERAETLLGASLVLEGETVEDLSRSFLLEAARAGLAKAETLP